MPSLLVHHFRLIDVRLLQGSEGLRKFCVVNSQRDFEV